MADLGPCFQAKGLLIQANAVAVGQALARSVIPDECVMKPAYITHIRSFVEEERSLTCASSLAPDGLVPNWQRFDKELSNYFIVCRHCLLTTKEEYYDIQRSIWERLPEMMGVEVEVWD